MRVAVDETAVKINGEWSWLYAAIDIDSKLLLGVNLFERCGTDQATKFLRQLTERHDLTDTEFLVDGYGYLTVLFRLDLSGHLDYVNRNLIKRWFHILKVRVDRFHNSWVGSRAAVAQWVAQFAYYYNFQRPHQALDDRTSAEALNYAVPNEYTLSSIKIDLPVTKVRKSVRGADREALMRWSDNHGA